jgi:hypothetical protein
MSSGCCTEEDLTNVLVNVLVAPVGMERALVSFA